ncbi:type II toxin-antitoxin system death-on-curing family toxin [Phaeobacter gallaeciensis]|uniref:type II toxin-antitoxin system death-on-curing family toxin n=1 Tax=Phaeobacter gallaeciensis TaxID=60890 RepID=UPI002380ACFB|nr:type II toxin-antitoxin system death-on-curing family toxin [Phaeobacter gallaeciensis]MDE4297136.1 type II toxin-antitoxin system death-on-curing family toxin [Phaeobacter gallaeciensis]
MPYSLPEDFTEVYFLGEEDVVSIHDNFALKTGGRPGMLKKDDLLSAIGRPEQAALYDENADLILIAAYYWHGISTSHGFVDGNKRTGLLAGIVFLGLNDVGFNMPENEPGEMVNGWMERGEFTLERLDAYLREHCFVMDQEQA